MQRIFTISILFVSTFSPVAAQFWQEHFPQDVFQSGWTTVDLNENSNAQWEWCPADPLNCAPNTLSGGAFSQFQSTSASDGYIYMDSRTLGSSFSGKHIAQILSPPIFDCVDKAQVFLEFESYIITANNNAAENAVLRICDIDSCYTIYPYPAYFRDNGNNESRNPEKLNFDISAYAAFKDSIRLQWEWTGKNEFAWAIDDLVLYDYDPGLPEGTVWSERFNGNVEGWDFNVIEGDTVWEWNAFGDVGKGLLALDTRAIESVTAHDGAIVLDADFYSTQGTEIPAFFPFLVTECISPPIDLSDVDRPVSLQFTQLVRLQDLAPDAPENENGEQFISSFAISLDGGNSFGPPINANYGLGQTLITNSTQIFPLVGLEGQSDVRIKFTWAGNLYYWVLDDIILKERPAYDMQVNRNFYARMPNAMTPLSQVAAEAFMADVSNVGYETASNVSLELNIWNTQAGAQLHSDTNFYGDLPQDFLAENVIFEALLDTMPFDETGIYVGSYRVRQDSVDLRPENDQINWRFELTDSTFSKEFGANRSVAPSSSELSYSYGNCFYIPNGMGWEATSMSFAVGNAPQLENVQVNTYLYEILDDLNGDGELEPGEYIENPVAFNSYTFTSDEGLNLITVPIGVDSALALKDDTQYMAVIEYNAGGSNTPFFIRACDTIDYSATWVVADSLQEPRFITALDIGNTGTFSTSGFGFNIVPVIRLNVNEIISAVWEPTIEVQAFRLWPNPAKDEFTVYFDLNEQVKDLQIEVRETSGRSVITRKISDIKQKAITFGSQDLAPGVYFVVLQGQHFHSTRKLIIY